MFPDDPDPIGDMQCVLSIKSTIPFVAESKKFPVNFSEHMYFAENEVGEYINVPSYLTRDYGISIFLKKMEVSELEGLLVFKISSNEYPDMEILRELVEIPSVAIDYKFIEDGYHRIIFTFHSTHIRRVSQFIFKARKTFGSCNVDYLGKNRGFTYVIERASGMEKLVAGVLSIKSPQSDSEQMKPLLETKWARRSRFTVGGKKSDYLYRIETPPKIDPSIMQCISEREHIYRAPTASSVSLLYSRLLFEHYNPMFYQYHEFDGETLKIGGIVSETYLKTLLEVVSEASHEFPRVDIRLSYAAEVQRGHK